MEYLSLRTRFTFLTQKTEKKLVLKEMHDVSYASHYGYQKTITTVKKDYYWQEIQNEIANYIPRWLECEKVKFEYRHPTGLLQPL